MSAGRVLVVGVGLVGGELVPRLRAAGWHVTGTTTTPARAGELKSLCDDVAVLRGSDTAAVHAAAAGADAVVVCAGPTAARAQTREQRAESYREVLVDTARSVATIPGDPYLVALSSLSVYGAAEGAGEVTEESATTRSDDPSPVNFIAAEREYLAAAGDRACVFRCADIFGAGDPPLETKIKMAHEYMAGSVPFRPDARFYRVHVSDVAAAIEHALERRLTGIFNLTHAGVPPRNAELFDTVGARLGFPAFEYRSEIESPVVPVSTAKLQATGFALVSTPVEQV